MEDFGVPQSPFLSWKRGWAGCFTAISGYSHFPSVGLATVIVLVATVDTAHIEKVAMFFVGIVILPRADSAIGPVFDCFDGHDRSAAVQYNMISDLHGC